MLRVRSLPGSLMRVLEAFRPCFTGPSFHTFAMLAAGLAACPARRTVCGMWTAAGLARFAHHSRAHRFFSSARWCPDAVGLVVLRLIGGWLVPAGAPLLIAVDDTMFKRWGRKVHAAHWGYDGSLKIPRGGKKLSKGNTFVVAAVVVMLPFLDRPVALPVLTRLWRKNGPVKTLLAREMIEILAAHRRGRVLHVVGDCAYVCRQVYGRDGLPRGVTLTGTMPRHASLAQVHPYFDQPRPPGTRGRVRRIGEKIGTPADLAHAVSGRKHTVTRYGRTSTITVHEQRCLWPGVFRCHPIRVLLIIEPGQPTISLATTDLITGTSEIIERYAGRWSIEVTFAEAKNTTGAGEARNRTRHAVERTVPFALFTHSIVIIWYHIAGHHPSVVREHRARSPWYTTKHQPSYQDMLIKLRRVIIAAQFSPGAPSPPTPEQINAVHLAWAQAAA